MPGERFNIRGIHTSQFDTAYVLCQVAPSDLEEGDVCVLYNPNLEPLTYNGEKILVITGKKEDATTGQLSLNVVPYTPTKVATKPVRPPYEQGQDENGDKYITMKMKLKGDNNLCQITEVSLAPMFVPDPVILPSISELVVVSGGNCPTEENPNPDQSYVSLNYQIVYLNIYREGTDDTPELGTYDHPAEATITIKGDIETSNLLSKLAEAGVLYLCLRD